MGTEHSTCAVCAPSDIVHALDRQVDGLVVLARGHRQVRVDGLEQLPDSVTSNLIVSALQTCAD